MLLDSLQDLVFVFENWEVSGSWLIECVALKHSMLVRLFPTLSGRFSMEVSISVELVHSGYLASECLSCRGCETCEVRYIAVRAGGGGALAVLRRVKSSEEGVLAGTCM